MSGGRSSQSSARAVEDARPAWEKRPPLPPDRNPLLGRWAKPAADQTNLMGAIQSLVSGAACGLFFGTDNGFVEFRPTTIVAVSRDGREQVLAETTYRGGDKRVAVLPKVTPQALIDLFVFNIDGQDRVTLVNSDCKMIRAGAVSARSGSAPAASTLVAGAAPTSRNGSAPLMVVAGLAGPGGAFQPLVGGSFFVLKESADAILAKSGVRSSPQASPLKTWIIACGTEQPVCGQGLMEIVKRSVAVMKTDSTGQAQLAGLPSGTYYLFGPNRFNTQPILWHVKTDLGDGAKPVVLDQRNATPLN